MKQPPSKPLPPPDVEATTQPNARDLGAADGRASTADITQPLNRAAALPTRPLPPPRSAPEPARRPNLAHAESLVGAVFGRHRLVRLMGKGGMGAVYEAEHIKIGRRDAVKVLFPDLAGPENAERFLREAQAANQVKHSNVVQIYHFGTADDGLLYIVMELLHGTSLDARLKKCPHGMPRAEALQLANEVADALAAVHKVNIVHRDLTPRNIMLVPRDKGRGEQAKLLDFGIAKMPPRLLQAHQDEPELTATGIAFGTLEYMPPEQFRDARSVNDKGDVFSLGVILCEMLGGLRPFDGYANRLFAPDAPKPNLPSLISTRLRALLERMLAFDSSQRPTMAEVSKVLERELRQRSYLPPIVFGGAVTSLLIAGLLWMALRKPPPPSHSAPQQVPPAASTPAELRVKAREVLNRAGHDIRADTKKLISIEIAQNRLSEFCPLLLKLINDSNIEIRLEAVRAISKTRCQQPQVRLGLSALAAAQVSSPLQVEAAAALAALGDPLGRTILRTIAEQRGEKLSLLAAQRWCELGDPAGASSLAGLLANSTSRPVSVEIEFKRALATQGQEAAVAWLQAQMVQADEPIRLIAAAALAQLRGKGTQAAEALALVEKRATEENFTAAVQAAQLHSATGLPTLQRWVNDAEKKIDHRLLAIRALGASGLTTRALPILSQFLLPDASQEYGPLSIAAAAATLRLLGDERDPKEWELSLLSSSASSASLLDWLDHGERLTQQQATSVFGKLSGEQRRLMTTLLGNRDVSQALGLLRIALDDANSDVRIEGTRALRGLLQTLEGKGKALSPALAQQLERMSTSTKLSDQVVAAALRARFGDASAEAVLLRILTQAADVRVRELVVELSPQSPQSQILLTALRNSALSVRFIAARNLVQLGSAAGRPVFEELLRLGGGYAMAAYGWLRRLGDKPKTLNWLSILSTEQSLLVRYEAVSMLGDLPGAEVLPLLRFILSDPAAVVRSRAGDVAAAMYRIHRQPEYLEILQVLLTDSEEGVRLHAARLLHEFLPEAQTDATPRPAQELKQTGAALPTEALDQSTLPHVDLGTLDLAVSVATSLPDRSRAPQAGPDKPLQPPASRLLIQAALLAEQKGELLIAMNKLDTLFRLPSGQRSSANEREAQQAIERLKKQLGSFQVWHKVNGLCAPEDFVRWGRPGYNQVNVDGKLYNVFVYKGKHKDRVDAPCN